MQDLLLKDLWISLVFYNIQMSKEKFCLQNFQTHISQSVSLVTQSCPTLCNPMYRNTPGLPIHYQLPESTQIHAHRASDAIQPSHVVPFSSCPQSLPASRSFPVSQLFA